MKKSLVLAMAMALGVTASAYAANPFSDVPAGHWAYDSVAKLAAAGIVDGYADGAFAGDKLMTRYEMAQIVAKAMAKGANVDKLAAEFADELDTLGVRVAKLEKGADAVKITGQIRYEYADRDGSIKNDSDKKLGSIAKHRLRTRLFLNGQVNDDWSYTARLQNDQNLADDAGNETTKLNQAYLNGKLGGLKVVAGRAPQFLANGNLYDDTADMVSVTYGKDVKLNAYYGKPTDYGFENFYGASLSTKVGGLGLSVGYDKFQDALNDVAFAGDGGFVDKDGDGKDDANTFNNNVALGEDNAIWNVMVTYQMGDIGLNATYLNSDIGDEKIQSGADTDGYVLGVTYKGAKASKPGSWGLWANYYDQGAGTFYAHTMKAGDWGYFLDEGFKGYAVGATYGFAKNIVGHIDYYDLEGKESGETSEVIWSRLQVTF